MVNGRKVGKIFNKERRVRQQNGEEAGKRKIVAAGYTMPAWIMAFCGICDIPLKEENIELLRLLEVPGAVAYVIDGLCEELEQRTISF